MDDDVLAMANVGNQTPVVMFLGWSNTYVAAAETHWMGIIYTDSSIECKEQQ
jgi:hypothetical protein